MVNFLHQRLKKNWHYCSYDLVWNKDENLPDWDQEKHIFLKPEPVQQARRGDKAHLWNLHFYSANDFKAHILQLYFLLLKI